MEIPAETTPDMVIILLCVVVIIIGRSAALIASRVEKACPANGKSKLRPLVLGSRIAWAFALICWIPFIFEKTFDLLTGNKDDLLALVFAFCFVAFLCLGVIASLSTIVDAWLRIRAARGKV